MANNTDKGVIYTNAEDAIDTNYNYGESFDLSACGEARLFVAITLADGTSVTSVTLKCLSEDADGNKYDLISYKLDTNSGQPELEHVYSALADDTTHYFLIKVLDCKLVPGFLVATKADDIGGAGDSISVYCFAW